MKAKTAEPSSKALVFKCNIMLPEGAAPPLERVLEAGKPSPWFSEDQVPEPLRAFIGEPDFSIPRDNEMQHWTRPEQLRAEAEAFRQLADDPYFNVPESARAVLEAIDEAAYERAKGMAALTQRNENPRSHYE
jgi:hypothetical protein